MVQAADGFFYGTASSGGANGRGTIFRLATDGSGFQVLHTFSATTVNTTSGLLTTQTTATGAPSNTATLAVGDLIFANGFE